MNLQKPVIKYIALAIIAVAVVIAVVVVFKNKATNQGAAVSSIPLACSRTNLKPQIEVSSPNGGEVFTAGQQITVKWRSCNIPATGNLIAIELVGGFPGSVVNFMELGPVNYSVNDGSEVVTLPTQAMNSFMQYGMNFKIRVVIEGYGQGISNNLFTINAPVVVDPCASVAQPIAVTVDPSSPATGTYNAGSTGNDFGHFRITAACPVKITTLGVGQNWGTGQYSATNPPASSYKFYDGATLLGSSSLSTGITNLNGYFSLTAGQSKIITVKLDLTAQTVDKALRVLLGVNTSIQGSSTIDSSYANWFKVRAGGQQQQCITTGVGTETVALDPSSPVATTFQRGASGVEFARIKVTNTGSTLLCYDGIQVGSNMNVNNFLTNIKVIDVSNGQQVGSTIPSLNFNGSYYYEWAMANPAPNSIPIASGASRSFKFVADIPSLASTGNIQLGIFGINHNAPGATGFWGIPVLGAVMRIQ